MTINLICSQCGEPVSVLPMIKETQEIYADPLYRDQPSFMVRPCKCVTPLKARVMSAVKTVLYQLERDSEALTSSD